MHTEDMEVYWKEKNWRVLCICRGWGKESLGLELRIIFKVLGLLFPKGYENRLFGTFLRLRAFSPMVVIQQFFIKSVNLLIQSSLGLLQVTQNVSMSLAELL